jgi:hypothetical protein
VADSSSSLARFLLAVHRRQVALRVIERAGLGLLGACVVATALVCVSLWRGDDARLIAGIALAVGTTAGAIWGAMHHPSTFAAAVEADRQLHTSDLIATACTLGGDEHRTDLDPWSRTVVALAKECCRRHRPSEVLLRRLGGRAWAGIVLAVAFVGVLTYMSSNVPRAVAARGADRDQNVASVGDEARRQPLVELTALTPNVPPQPRTQLSPEDAASRPNDSFAQSVSPSSEQPKHDAVGSDGQHDARSAAPGGEGAGEASSESVKRDAEPRASNSLSKSSADPTDARTGDGVGLTALDPKRTGDAASGGIVEASRRVVRTPAPWTADTWPQTVEHARQTLNAGGVPDDARDLVRGYFDRAAASR